MTAPSLVMGVAPAEAAGRAPLQPFGEPVLAAAAEVSRRLLADPQCRAHPELVALGFWMRPASLRQMIDAWKSRSDGSACFARGTVLHFAPANVDTIFVYSWVLSMLCGNANIIRLSSRRSPQLELLITHLEASLSAPAATAVRERLSVVRYEHDESVSTELSALADTRVIWGGDETVATIRRLPLRATANEVAFANKVSLAVLDTAHWCTAAPARRTEIARAFANDAYWFDQAACSSPRVLLWRGGLPPDDAAADFWARVLAASEPIGADLSGIDFINKLVAGDLAASRMEVRQQPCTDNRLTRVRIRSADLPAVVAGDYHCGGGLFFEAGVASLAGLLPALTRRVQTLAYAGLAREELLEWAANENLRGIDRIVPMGSALDFAPVWDGFDLFDVFLRRVTVR